VIRNNRIAGILGHGIGPHFDGFLFGSAIVLSGEGDDFTIQGNTIGLNALGEPVLGSLNGISTSDYFLGPVQGVTIGGTEPGEGNEIAGHYLNAITVANPLAGVRISGNSIHDNDMLGIDLVASDFQVGVTLNDPLDTDTGGNGMQNYPVLSEARRNGTSIHIVGMLDSLPNEAFTIECFANPQCNSSGYGEGRVFLGTSKVTSDSLGHANFDVVYVAEIPDGWFATATATLEPIGSTSEFSACLQIVGGDCVADLNGDGILNFFDVQAFLQAFASGGLAGDWVHDGVLNFFDVQAYLRDFAAGCP
jgi:hypothetical protein